MGMPTTNGFIGELFILIGAFKSHWILSIPVVVGILLGVVYLLWMFQRVFLGDFVYHGHHPIKDLVLREKLAFVPIVLFVFWIGLYPKPFLQVTDASLNHLIQMVEANSKKAGNYSGINGDVDERQAGLSRVTPPQFEKNNR
jgi:NADH-quinone oxidoreductase subunit M